MQDLVMFQNTKFQAGKEPDLVEMVKRLLDFQNRKIAMSKFKIEITSVSDRENLVAEIWYNEILVAEINQENENLEIEFYQSEKITFKFEEFLEILKTAKKELIKK